MTKLIHISLILILLSGCKDHSSPNHSESPTSTTEQATTTKRQPTYSEQIEAIPIPADITYKIIDESSLSNIKRSLNIRLNKKVSEGVLKSIALTLKKSDPKRYQRTFIVYYLPEMEVDAGGWATTHFNPELKVQILGLTVEQEQALKQKPDDSSRTIIGNWLDERPFVSNRTTIFQRNGKLYMENTFKDGSSGETELVEKKSSLGRRFEKADGSGADSGDHWILDYDGNLQLRDSMGLISTAKKLD